MVRVLSLARPLPGPLPTGEGVLWLDRDNFKFRIDFLLQHAFDSHQRAGKGTWATAASALITNAECVVLQADDLKIPAVSHQSRSHLLVENFIDAQKPRVVARDRRDRAA